MRAYLLYTEASAKAPDRKQYGARGEALRTQAALKALPMPRIASSEPPPLAATPSPSGFSTTITPDDLAEVRRLLPPPELKATPGRKTLDLQGDGKALFEQAARAFSLDVVFDGEYQPGQPRHLHLEDVDYRDALHAVEAASNSFVFPVGARLLMAANDTQPKRAALEPHAAITIPIPYTVTPQEAQELARSIQQAMDIMKFAVDAGHHMVLIQDRISKVRPARALFEQLACGRPQVAVEMQFLEMDRSALISYGLLLPNSFPIVFLGTNPSAAALETLARIFFGRQLFGLGIGDSGVFATMSRSSGKILLQAEVRSVDGAAATFHVGDKYPIASAQFLGADPSFASIPPSFTFEDLGLMLKITPHIHGTEEVSLDVNAEFKTLGGQSANGIPIIQNRKLESKVRLRNGEWAMVAGLMTNREARSISGIWGLSNLPLVGRMLRKNDTDRSNTEVVLLLKPTLLNLPPTEIVTRWLWVGSDGRLQIPL